MDKYNTLGVITAGAFGKSLGAAMHSNFTKTILYSRDLDVVVDINKQYSGNKSVIATNDINDTLQCDIIIIATPTQYVASQFKQVKFLKNSVVLIASKGIDIESHKLISDILLTNSTINKSQLGVLSGPTLAKLLTNNLISSFVVAMSNVQLAKQIANKLSNNQLRMYFSTDLNGVQVLGAIKNVIAIATGVAEGAKLGHNALSALISRSLVEISALVKHYKGNISSLLGVAGIGDLVLTATSSESRNFSLGLLIGKQGYFSQDLLLQLKGIPEGYYTTKAVHAISQKNIIDMPFCNAVYQLCYKGALVKDVVTQLMSRKITGDFTFN